MSGYQCPRCGRFLADVLARDRGEVLVVTGRCKTHGRVEPLDWDADDFVDVELRDEEKV